MHLLYRSTRLFFVCGRWNCLSGCAPFVLALGERGVGFEIQSSSCDGAGIPSATERNVATRDKRQLHPDKDEKKKKKTNERVKFLCDSKKRTFLFFTFLLGFGIPPSPLPDLLIEAVIYMQYACPPHKRFFVGCNSPFMRLAEHLTARRAWCKQCLPGW